MLQEMILNIRRKKGGSSHALRESFEVVRCHPEPGIRKTCKHHQEQGWQDAARAPLVEANVRKFPGLVLTENYRGDEIAADNKEHVHADVAAAKPLKTSMEKNDEDNCDDPQSINFSAVSESPGMLFHHALRYHGSFTLCFYSLYRA